MLARAKLAGQWDHGAEVRHKSLFNSLLRGAMKSKLMNTEQGRHCWSSCCCLVALPRAMRTNHKTCSGSDHQERMHDPYPEKITPMAKSPQMSLGKQIELPQHGATH